MSITKYITDTVKTFFTNSSSTDVGLNEVPTVDSVLNEPQQNCYRWDRCDGGSGNIYTVTSYTPTDDTVLYYGVCYEQSNDIVIAEPTDLSSIPSNQFFGKCSLCSPCNLGCSLTFGPVSPSVTPTNTVTPTQTPSNSVTPSTTPSITPTTTPSNTTTPSVTSTPDESPSTTPSITPTTTPSNTTTPSVTPSVTPTTTPSNTATPSVTPTPTISVTPTVTPSSPEDVTWYRVGLCCESDTPPVVDLGVSGGTANPNDGLLYDGVSISLASGGNPSSDVIDASELIANYCSTITCPSLTPTTTVTPTTTPTTTPTITTTPTNSVTPTVTATPSSSVPETYSRYSLNTCCDNHYPGVVTITEANILDSLGVGEGDIVALDGICYTIFQPIPNEAPNTPSTQVSYVDCETCLSNVSVTNRCAHTYVACFEDSYGAGDLMAAPTRVNTLISTNNPVGTADENIKFTHNVDNSDGTEVSFDDCYTYDPTYNSSHTFKIQTDQHNGCCADSVKCGGAYVILRTCDDYVGSVTSLNGQQLEALTLMPCEFVSGSSIGGGVVQLTDTIQSPELLGSEYYLGTSQDTIIYNDGFSGICFTIVGNTSNLNSQQTQLQGTDWVTESQVVTNCNYSDCHCLNDIVFTNNNISPYTIKYLECGVTGPGNFTSVPVPAGGTTTLTDCINVNSLVLYRTNDGQIANVDFDYGSVGSCDEYTYFSGLDLCCDSTDTPITGPVGFLNTLNVSVNDYVVVNGDAYQVTGTTTSNGTQYPSATGGYTSCSDAVSNATNPCRYDMEPCCTQVGGPSYYSPFTLELNIILTIGDTYYTTQPNPYPGVTDKCMSVQSYTGTYPVDTLYQQTMLSNGNGCINRCSRCSYLVRPCGWSTNYILWNVNTQVGMTVGSVWEDTGLAAWLSANLPGAPSADCVEILSTSPTGGLLGNYGSAYNFTQTLVTGCSDPAC